MSADLLDAQAAVDWAVEQMPILQKRIEAWAALYSTRIAIDGGRKAYYIRANPVPASINAETGSIINSIRSSLDLLASALAARNGHAGSRNVYFPVCGTPAQFAKDGRAKVNCFRRRIRPSLRLCNPTMLQMGCCLRCTSWTLCESTVAS